MTRQEAGQETQAQGCPAPGASMAALFVLPVTEKGAHGGAVIQVQLTYVGGTQLRCVYERAC